MRVEGPVFMLVMRSKPPVPSHPPFRKAGFEKWERMEKQQSRAPRVIQTEGLVITHLEKKKGKLGVPSQGQPP